LMSVRLNERTSKIDMRKLVCDEKLTCHMRRLCCSKKTCAMFTSADSYIVQHQVEACRAMQCSIGFLQFNIPEPAIRFPVVRAAATAGEFCAGDDAQIFLGL
jgi:hypothetical protein